MAEASNTHDYWQLSRLARWHVESEALDQALAIVVAATLPTLTPGLDTVLILRTATAEGGKKAFQAALLLC